MRSILRSSLFVILPFMVCLAHSDDRSASNTFPILKPVSMEEDRRRSENRYKIKLAEWEAQPKVFHKYQVIELIKINTKYKMFEVGFFNLGKIGLNACEEKLKEPALDASYISSRCRASTSIPRKPSKPGKYHVNLMVEGTRGISYQMETARDCEDDAKKSKQNYVGSPEAFTIDKQYCAISRQYSGGSFDRHQEEKMSRRRKKPSFFYRPRIEINAITSSETIGCNTEYAFLDNPKYWHNFTAKRCYIIPAGVELSINNTFTDKDGNHLRRSSMLCDNCRSSQPRLYIMDQDITITVEETSAF